MSILPPPPGMAVAEAAISESELDSMFKPATKEANRLRMVLFGPSKSGKTYTALRLAFGMVKLKAAAGVVMISTEPGNPTKYLGESPDGIKWEWVQVTMTDFNPTKVMRLIQKAGELHPSHVLIIDSLSAPWTGKGGVLDVVDKSGKNKFTDGWKVGTPMQNGLIEAIEVSPCHVIATMRVKSEYVLEENERGQKVPRKVGMKPIQRDGVEHSFDIECSIDEQHMMSVDGSRLAAIDGQKIIKPDAEFMVPVVKWLNE